MEQDVQRQIQARVRELPADVQNTIQSTDFGRKIHEIGTRHQLHIDQIGAFEDEVLLVLLAFSDPGDFVSNLVQQVQVDETVANMLADEVASEIILPIRTSMQRFMEAKAAQYIMEDEAEPLEIVPSSITLKPTVALHNEIIAPSTLANSPVPVSSLKTPVGFTPLPAVARPMPATPRPLNTPSTATSQNSATPTLVKTSLPPVPPAKLAAAPLATKVPTPATAPVLTSHTAAPIISTTPMPAAASTPHPVVPVVATAPVMVKAPVQKPAAPKPTFPAADHVLSEKTLTLPSGEHHELALTQSLKVSAPVVLPKLEAKPPVVPLKLEVKPMPVPPKPEVTRAPVAQKPGVAPVPQKLGITPTSQHLVQKAPVPTTPISPPLPATPHPAQPPITSVMPRTAPAEMSPAKSVATPAPNPTPTATMLTPKQASLTQMATAPAPAATPGKPRDYHSDPYHEPVE